MAKYDIYFAGPLFNEEEKAFNLELTGKLEAMGLKVFLPQRDGLEFAKLNGMAPNKRNQEIFKLDAGNVEGSPVIIAVLDGAVPDDGTTVEIAIAREFTRRTGEKKLVLGLKSDDRIWEEGSKLNPMLVGSVDHLFDSSATLLAYVKTHLREIKAVAARAPVAARTPVAHTL